LGGFFLLPAQPAFAATTQLTWLDLCPGITSFRQLLPDLAVSGFWPTKITKPNGGTTGNLETSEGRPFGFQLTFFRQALIPTAAAINLSPQSLAWQTYSAHFTISDIAQQRFIPMSALAEARSAWQEQK